MAAARTEGIAPARLLAFPVAALLAWLCIEAMRAGSAGAIVYDAATEMATWEASGAPPGAQTIAWVTADLERAQRMTPGDPQIDEMLGELARRRIDRADAIDDALAHFSRAVELRPASPYTWAAIVEARYHKGDIGPAFEAAVRRAADLGPSEPEVQRTVVDFGLATWDEIGPSTRQSIERMVTGAMRRDPGEILQIAERRGRLAVACRHLPDAPRRADSEWLITCRSREATS